MARASHALCVYYRNAFAGCTVCYTYTGRKSKQVPTSILCMVKMEEGKKKREISNRHTYITSAYNIN
jgi:hypothetical protein